MTNFLSNSSSGLYAVDVTNTRIARRTLVNRLPLQRGLLVVDRGSSKSPSTAAK